ncbi:sugar phosphate isomerase/epimerase family protein [Halotia wernerae UHCC 0503]|nr:sugar phosphate isomerase/epimerase family protein [Halotia wernerae UHCC 0503]
MTRKIAVNQITTPQWSLLDAIKHYAQTDGIQGIGIWADKLAAINTSKAAQLLQDKGLQVSTLVIVANFTRDVKQGIETGKQAIENAYQLGCKTILTVVGPRMHLSVEKGNALTREALEVLSPIAQQADVTLALEPLHPMDITRFSTIITIPQTLTVIKDLPNIGLIFDTWNTWWEPDLSNQLQYAKDSIACVQLADWQETSDNPHNRTVPGNGVIHLQDLMQQVKQLGYQGWYEVEIMSDQYQPEQYPELLEKCVRGAEYALSV